MLIVTFESGKRKVYDEPDKHFLNMLFNYYWANKERLKIERIEVDYEH